VPAAALLIGMFFAPDSPRFLYAQGKKEEARDVLKRIRPAGTAEEELRDIEADVSTESKNWKELLRPAIRPALMVGIGLAIFQQVTGINTIIYYAPTIFQFTGISSNTSSILATVVVGVVNVLLTIVALFLIDRIGRRPLLLGGLVGMVLSLVGLGVAFLFPNLGALSWIALACLVVYVGSFAIGLGPVFWLLISEIYPTSLRGRASSVATVANWAANLVVTLTFLTLIDLLGKSGTFWLYGLIGIGCWVFTYYLVPETKGRTLEEIQEKWEKDSQPAERPLKPGRGAMPEG
jgi:sugar porter (SP) family MFS transporter